MANITFSGIKSRLRTVRGRNAKTNGGILMSDRFEIMERRDEEQILAEAQGNIINEMFYKFKVSGREVTGISWVGTKEIARRYGGIKIALPQVETDEEYVHASVAATDTKNDLTLIGTSSQPRIMKLRDGGEKVDPFARVKAVSKAQRNAIRALIPETFLLEMEKTFTRGETSTPGRRVVDSQAEVDIQPPARPDPENVKAYFQARGYDPERFTVWEDEPTGLLLIKIRGFIDNPTFRDDISDLGAYWDQEQKTYVVNL
jgi:hypothetical protein